MKTKTAMLSTLLCLSPILLGLALYDQLPEMVPTHFNMSGEADGWSSKTFAVFGLPLFMAGMNLICHWGMGRAMKKEGQKVAPDVMMNFVGWIVGILSVIVVPMSLFAGLGVAVPIHVIMNALLAVMFLFVGNYLPKCKMNAYIGIKLPWTYSSEENWRRTHRLGGFVWVAAGVALVANFFIGSEFLLIAAIAAAILIPCVYSYLFYRQEKA